MVYSKYRQLKTNEQVRVLPATTFNLEEIMNTFAGLPKWLLWGLLMLGAHLVQIGGGKYKDLIIKTTGTIIIYLVGVAIGIQACF